MFAIREHSRMLCCNNPEPATWLDASRPAREATKLAQSRVSSSHPELTWEPITKLVYMDILPKSYKFENNYQCTPQGHKLQLQQ